MKKLTKSILAMETKISKISKIMAKNVKLSIEVAGIKHRSRSR